MGALNIRDFPDEEGLSTAARQELTEAALGADSAGLLNGLPSHRIERESILKALADSRTETGDRCFGSAGGTSPLCQERLIAPVGRSWDSFFRDGPPVSDDVLAERGSQEQADRESF